MMLLTYTNIQRGVYDSKLLGPPSGPRKQLMPVLPVSAKHMRHYWKDSLDLTVSSAWRVWSLRIWQRVAEAENIPVLAWPAYSTDMSPIEHVWDVLDRHMLQRVSRSCRNFAQPLKRSGPTFHRPP